jgi:hypothetical protein
VLALAIFRRRRSDRKRLSTRGCSVCAVIPASNSGREQCMVSGSPGPMWRPRNAGVRGGTMSSNLLCSSGESAANLRRGWLGILLSAPVAAAPPR